MATVAGEIWNSANMGFGLCPLLTLGAIDAIEAQGSDALKQTYLPKMVSGEWSGTMNLTEPHAGSDLSQLKTRAVKQADGSYRIFGTKIFITYGDHELTDNIIHLVLARLPDAPPGTRGISLFLVPKICVNEDGSLGARNDVVCAGVEHKLGIHASPTCVMKYGEKGEGAVGYLVGEENRGLNVMFIMMNAARLAVGMQGVAVAERATQRALSLRQGAPAGPQHRQRQAQMAPIIEHADIRRSLMTMKALTQAARAICLVTARETDVARRAKNAGRARRGRASRGAAHARGQGVRHRHRLRGGLHRRAGARRHGLHRGDRRRPALSRRTHPADLRGHQRHPGHRPGRTQAAAGRRQGGRWTTSPSSRPTVEAVRASNRPEFGRMGERLGEAVAALAEATRWIGGALERDPDSAMAARGSLPASVRPRRRRRLPGQGRARRARNGAGGGQGDGQRPGDGKADVAHPIAIARFFAETLATAAPGLKDAVVDGAAATLLLAPDAL